MKFNFDMRDCYKMAMGGYRVRFETSGQLCTFLKRGKYWRFARIEREAGV
jgi:hypothetical protein